MSALAPPAAARRPKLPAGLIRHGALALLLAGHLLLGLGYGLAAPLLEAPDEPGHYLYVRYLQAYHQLPVQGAVFDAPRAHHPPGYYVLGALLTSWVTIAGPPDRVTVTLNPHFGFRPGDAASLDNRAAFLHHGPEERFPYQGQARGLHLLRLLSLAFSTLAVACTYGAARLLRPGQPAFALLAAGLLAFNPIVLFASGLVYTDTAALGASAAMVYALSRTARQGFTVQRWLWVGLIFAAGLLLKSSLMLLAAPALLLLTYQAWSARKPRLAFTGAAALALPPLVLAGWWYARNLALYGDWTANSSIALLNGLAPPAERWANLPANVAFLLRSLTGCGPLGPGSLCYPPTYFVGAAVLMMFAATGLAVGAWRWGQALTTPRWHSGARIWLGHALLVAAVGGSALVFALTYRNTWQGRLWLPAFPSLALAAAAGVLAWVAPRRQALAAAACVTLAAAVGAYGLFGLVLPAYGLPRGPWPLELRGAEPLDAQVGEAARVLAFRLERDTVSGGETLAVTVYWQALARTPSPYTVFVHLYSPEAGSLAQRDTYPGLGNYATTLWDPGRVFVDTYRLDLPNDVPATQAVILLGLYDEATGQRLPVTGADAGPAENRWVEFGSVAVKP